MTDQLPTADDFFGPAEQPAPLPTADEFFAPTPLQSVGNAIKAAATTPVSSPIYDEFFTRYSAHHVLGAFGQGMADGWGDGPLGLSPEVEQFLRKQNIFNDYAAGQSSLVKSFNEAIVRPAAVALDGVLRAGGAMLGGYQNVAVDTGKTVGLPHLGRDLAAMPEAFFGSPFGHGTPHPILEQAHDLRVIGAGEDGWKAGPAPADAVPDPAAPAAATPPGEPGSPADAPAPAAPPADVHQLARQIDPGAFSVFDALSARQEALRGQLDELAETRRQDAEANAPHAAALDAIDQQMADLAEKGGYHGKRQALQAQRDQLAAANGAAIDQAVKTDTPEMASARAALQDNDYRMRDLAPQVSAAYREAEARMPPEAEPAAAPAETPAEPPLAEPAPAAEPPVSAGDAPAESVASAAEPSPTAPPVETTAAHLQAIKDDVVTQLTAKGRPADEAAAAAEVVASRYDARAAAFEGRKGSALDLYRDADIHVQTELEKGKAGASGEPALYQAAELPGAEGRTAKFDNDLRFWKGGMDRLFSGRLDKPLRLGRSFSVLREMGIQGKSLDLLPEAAAKIIHDHPDIPRAVWDRLPELVADPRYVMPYHKGGVRVVLDAVSDKGEPIYAGISDGKLNTVFVRNDAEGLTGQQRLSADLQAAASRSGKIYAKERAVPAEADNAVRPQLPDAAPKDVLRSGTKAKIITREDVIKKQDSIFYQGVLGETSWENGHAIVTLFKDANASTFMHECGHIWLREMLTDAADPAASPQMQADAAMVRRWLRMKEGAPTEGQHETFARGFERYLYTGRAPSPELARVFAQFRAWMTEIYGNMRALGRPISADVKDVFDRLIAADPKRQPLMDLREASSEAAVPADVAPSPRTWMSKIYGKVRDLGRRDPADVKDGFDRSKATVPTDALKDAAPSAAPAASAPAATPKAPRASTPYEPVPPEPRRLADFLKRQGGLADDGGDVKHILGDGRSRPGLINQAGLSLDEAAHRAWEAGYFPDHGETRPTPNDLLAALSEDLKGNPRYSAHDAEAVSAHHGAIARNAEIDRLSHQFTREQILDAANAAQAEDGLAADQRSRDEAHQAEQDEAAAKAQDFLKERGESWEPDGAVDSQPRTLEDLEKERQREEDARLSALRPDLPGPVVDKAGNIRLDLLDAPEDVKTLIRQVAEENNGFIDARRGKLSDAQVMGLAEDLGMDAASLNTRKLGQAFNAEEVVAARRLLVQSAEAVREAMDKAAEGSDADVMAYAEARARHMTIQEQVAGLTAEAGRALRAFRSMAGMADAEALGKLLAENWDLTLFQLREEARLGRTLDNPSSVSKFLADARKPGFKDMIVEYYIHNLISGLITHAGYAVHNSLLIASKLGSTAIGGGIGAAHEAISGKPVEGRMYAGEVKAQLFGLGRGLRAGLPAAWEALKTGVLQTLPGESLPDLFGNQALPSKGAIPGWLGEILRAPARPVQAVHALTRWMAYSQEVHSLAYRAAAAKGLEGQALATETARLLSDPPVEMMSLARDVANNMALMQRHEWGSGTSLIAKFTNNNVFAKVVVPFVSIQANVMRWGLSEHSVLGLLSQDVRDNLAGRNGEAAREGQAGRLVLGTMISTAIMSLMAEDRATDSGPDDPRERAMWIAAGHQPYSIKIGDHWIPYRGGPMGSLMAVSADIYGISQRVGHDDLTALATSLVHGIGRAVLDESWMRGLKDLMNVVDRPDTSGKRWAQGLATNFAVPFSVGMGQVARAVDPYMRDTQSLLDAIRAHIPGASLDMMPRRDVWGEPMQNHGTLSVNGPAPSTPDPVSQEMYNLGVWPAKLPRQIRGVDLTDQQYDDFQRLAGRYARMRTQAMVNTPGWSSVPDFARREALAKGVTNARENARSVVMMQNPQIIQQAVQNKLTEMRGE